MINLGVPPIADRKARGRADAAGSLLTGGLVSILAAILQLVPPHLGLVGVALLVGGGAMWTQAIRCPKCDDRWAWHAIRKHGLKEGARWLSSLEACPECAYTPRSAPPRSDELQRAIDRACATVERSSLDISAAHLLLEVLGAESVIGLLRDMEVDVDRVKAGVSALVPIDHIANPDPRPARLARDARECMRHAAIHAASSDAAEITSSMILLAYFSEAPLKPLRRVLEQAGLSRYGLRKCIAHGSVTNLDPTPAEGLVGVVLHNDPFTDLQFVHEVLTQLFGLSSARARELAQEIQDQGSSVIGELTATAADERVIELRRRALARDFPLRVTFEDRKQAH